MKSLINRYDDFLVRIEPWAKWFMIAWTVLAAGIVLLSNLMIRFDWAPLGTFLPLDVRDNLKVALLVAPGGVVAALYLIRGVKR